jgi:hypothetical protein
VVDGGGGRGGLLRGGEWHPFRGLSYRHWHCCVVAGAEGRGRGRGRRRKRGVSERDRWGTRTTAWWTVKAN